MLGMWRTIIRARSLLAAHQCLCRRSSGCRSPRRTAGNRGALLMMPSEPLAVRVRAIEPLSPTLKHIVLENADGGVLPTSLPGAHLAMILPGRERAYRNSYSIITTPDERSRYEIIVRRTTDSRGGSAFVHASLRTGDVIISAAPNNQFPLRNKARRHLL